MKRLYIVRHGVAVEHGAPGYTDDERPLTREGEKRLKKVARGLRKLDVMVDRICTSPLPRARRTAEIIANELDAAEILEDVDALRAQNDAVAIREWLNTRSEPSLMIVGHNPALSDLVSLLLTGQSGESFCELDKGGVASLVTTDEGRVVLDWLARARLLRKL